MPSLVWNKEKYSVGIEELDNQHKELFSIFNDLYESYNSDKNDNLKLKNIFYRLIDFMFKHIESEETIMEKYNYPRLNEHKELHNSFKERITKYYDKYRFSTEYENMSVITPELVLYLYNWITFHTTNFDLDYGYYLKKNKLI